MQTTTHPHRDRTGTVRPRSHRPTTIFRADRTGANGSDAVPRPDDDNGVVVGTPDRRRPGAGVVRTSSAVDQLLPGERVVHLGATGDAALDAVDRVGTSGWVVTVDEDPLRITRTRQVVALHCLDNVDVCFGSVADLPVTDGWADRVVAPSPVEGTAVGKNLSEIHRGLRSGGVVHFVTRLGPTGVAVDDTRSAALRWARRVQAAGFSDVSLASPLGVRTVPNAVGIVRPTTVVVQARRR